MVNKKQNSDSIKKLSRKDRKFEVILHKAPIYWDLENGTLSFFGLDSTIFWTDPSLVNMLAPIAEEIGIDLFRLLVAHSSSLGTEEDYHAMVSTLGVNFEEGFLAWGRAVSAAGWGRFEMPEYNHNDKQATVIVKNPFEISVQRNLPPEKRWGSPFLQGKLIGIFSYAFGMFCWANDTCYYDCADPYAEIKIFPSTKTIKNELKKLRYERMLASERELADKVDQKTAELQQARIEIEQYSRTLELKVAERTEDLVKANQQLEKEIVIRKKVEAKKEMLILDLQKALKEVKTLSGMLPICASCKKIRDDKGYWNQIESYISQHADVKITHGLCQECMDAMYGGQEWYERGKKKGKF